MDQTLSVAKGVFIFNNDVVRVSRNSKKSSKEVKSVDLLGRDVLQQPFYQTFKKTWESLIENITSIHSENCAKVVDELGEFVNRSYRNNADNMLPVAVLLTGINQPDHNQQFETLANHIENQYSGLCTNLEARDCPNLKTTIEFMVSGFIDGGKCVYSDDSRHDDVKNLRRGEYTMQVLESWYSAEYPDADKTLVVITPACECFNVPVLQDFILILQSYCKRIPIVLVMGVTTSISWLHGALTYHVIRRMRLNIFQLQSAISGLDRIIEHVILSPHYKFRLSGKIFAFLTDTFLFYDFSINGFIQAVKCCLMEHFYQGNAFSLCDNYYDSLGKIDRLSHYDVETIRRLPSFRPFIESLNDMHEVIGFLTDDVFFKKKLPLLLKHCHIFFILFRYFLEFFTVIVKDLPNAPLGRHRREVYLRCVSSKVTELPEFKECWRMISFLSKTEFIVKIQLARNQTEKFSESFLHDDPISEECRKIINVKLKMVDVLLTKLASAGMRTSKHTEDQMNLTNMSRYELKEKLLEMSKIERHDTDFTRFVNETLDSIQSNIISEHLLPFTRGEGPPLLELFVFSDLWSVRQQIIGTPRASLHTALNDPRHYFRCKCCELNTTEDLLRTMPDVSIAYKLHLESGRLINLYDWLQAFVYVVDGNNFEESEDINPEIQARFTRAVAELQFLGYVKYSKRKTDHVTRLTW